MHSDIRDDRRETYTRLNSVEQRVSKLQATPSWDGGNRRQ